MHDLTCIRCGKPATIGEIDDAIGAFAACSDECHAAELADRTAAYQDELAGVYQRKRERIAAIREGRIEHPGYVQIKDETTDRSTAPADPATALDVVLARLEGKGAVRLES